ncbi:hypothetical protein BDN72DRAFT_594527 [Pluteus cervinus]|uniref:Uncharacterized protein n=1 Tax=Pluteus cervinus TaxID=181527 RepID=A0ACD3AV50_9AGAR|nr:hypothetical protein BDN72DRAFT_594527 [Pluteus cervinus]
MVLDIPPALNLSGLSKEDAYNKVESEILRLKDQIRSLLSVRNSLSPISNLPNELLAKIFMHCCDFNESGTYSNIRPCNGDNDDDRAQPEMRLVVSWVSRHWRNVAVEHRPLWDLVINLLHPPINLDYVNSCTARSQHIHVDLARPENNLVVACLSTMSRSKTTYLKLDFSFGATSTTGIRYIWTQPFPLLQTLTLHSINVRCDDYRSVGFPALQSLTLVSCTFNWAFVTSLASTISKLEIANPRTTIPIPTFVRLLQSFPRLSECILSSCLKDEEDSAPAIPRLNRMCLLQLTKMSLSESTGHIIQLLRFIDIPNASLKIIPDEPIDQDAAELLCILRDSHGRAWSSIHHLQLGDWFTVANSGAHLKHSIYTPRPHLLQPPACQHLDFTTLESLWARSLSIDLLEIFSHLTQLQRVVLESSDALEIFVTFMCTKAHNDASTLLFPALQELVLASLNSEAENWLEMLYDILASRKIWGFGLRKLVLFRCDKVGVGQFVRLKEVVGEVEFRRDGSGLLLT